MLRRLPKDHERYICQLREYLVQLTPAGTQCSSHVLNKFVKRISDCHGERKITQGNPSECPVPEEGTCSHPDSMKVARAACLGKSNCTVAKKDVGTLDCSSKIASGTENMIIAGVCGDGKQRRATNLRFDFALPAPVVRDPTPTKVARRSAWRGMSSNRNFL